MIFSSVDSLYIYISHTSISAMFCFCSNESDRLYTVALGAPEVEYDDVPFPVAFDPESPGAFDMALTIKNNAIKILEENKTVT